MDFGENLRAMRGAKGITQKELGEKIGVTPVTIGNWERGTRQPSFEFLVKLANALSVSTDVLLNNPRNDQCISLLIDRYIALDEHGRKAVDAICAIEYERVKPQTKVVQLPASKPATKRKRYLPFYTSPSAAGIAAPLEGADFEMLLADNSVPDDADFAVRISGDSMEPYIDDGSMVFVKEVTDIENGEVGIFCVDGAMYCKQFYKSENGNVYLLSANSNRIDANITLDADCSSSFYVSGKVLMNSIPYPDYFEH